MSGLTPKWVRLAPNGTNLGLFQIIIGLYTVDVTVAKNRSTRKASWEDTYTSYEAYT